MIIEKITAEDVKYFTNETTLSMIEKAGGMQAYLKMFVTHAKNSKKCAPQLHSVRVNGELIEHESDYQTQIESAIEGVEKKSISGQDADTVDLKFVYTALSDMDHTYFLITKEGAVLPGLECEGIEFAVDTELLPYVPPTVKLQATCGAIDFGLVNEDEKRQIFSYPEITVYSRNSAAPLLTVNFWDDEVLDCAEPDEVSYFADSGLLAEDLAGRFESLADVVKAAVK